MIASVPDEEGKKYPIAYMVSFGELREGTQKVRMTDLHEADLIIIVKDGSFWVWKDRNADRGPVSFNEAWDRIRKAVADHRKYKRQSRAEWMNNRP